MLRGFRLRCCVRRETAIWMLQWWRWRGGSMHERSGSLQQPESQGLQLAWTCTLACEGR